jgi:hypothetical protein
MVLKSSWKLYAPQTKILEVRTNVWERQHATKTLDNIGFERKLISVSPYLQSMREYLNLGLISTFHKRPHERNKIGDSVH